MTVDILPAVNRPGFTVRQNKATILKLLLRLKETQCELLAAQKNRDGRWNI
jgi:hypothetical protein